MLGHSLWILLTSLSLPWDASPHPSLPVISGQIRTIALLFFTSPVVFPGFLPAPFLVQGPQEGPLSGRAGRPLSHRLHLWRGWPWPVGDSPCGCLWLLMSFLVAGPSHQHPLFFQAALVDLTLVFLASQALRSFSSLGLAVSFSSETVWELNLNLINNV